MTEAKPMASLTPNLLARKGGARPVLRSQLRPVEQSAEVDRSPEAVAARDDDFPRSVAEACEQEAAANVVALSPAVLEVPAVRHKQAQLAARLIENDRQAPVRRSALAEGRSAAFTLRLDADRHLHLRLACTLANRSAQQLLTEALDQMLASLPEVADLAARVGKHR